MRRINWKWLSILAGTQFVFVICFGVLLYFLIYEIWITIIVSIGGLVLGNIAFLIRNGKDSLLNIFMKEGKE